MVFKFHFGFGIMRTSDDLFSQSLRLKRHDYGSQHPYLRQTLDISHCCLSKDIGFYRVPICQLHNLRCAAFKIKPNLTPFAVVVRPIQVDSGGYFFCSFCGTRSASALRYEQGRVPAASGAACPMCAGKTSPRRWLLFPQNPPPSPQRWTARMVRSSAL